MRLPRAHYGLEGRAPPMSRSISVCLRAVVALVALLGTFVWSPAPVRAATGTLGVETPLHDSPGPGAPVVALLPEGTVVSIDGPPVDGFYPVTAGDLSGWMRGETLSLEKDVVAEEAEASPPPAESDGLVPIEQTTSDDTAPVEAPATIDPAADPALTKDPAETGAEPAEAEPVADVASDTAEAAPTDAATLPADAAADPAPVSEPTPDAADPAAIESKNETIDAATPVPVDPATETPVDAAAEPAPETSATPSPTPVPEP